MALTCRIIRLSGWLCFFRVISILCLMILIERPVYCQIYVDIDKPKVAKMPVAVADLQSSQPGPLNGRHLAGIIKNDLYLTGLFQTVEPTSLPSGTPTGEPDFESWSQTGAQALITGFFQANGDQLVAEMRLYEVPMKKMLLGKRFTGRTGDHRQIMHKFADHVMAQLDKIPGCFSSRIAFVDASQSREIFSMDFDGHDLRQMTRTGALNLSPEWSPDRGSIVFTSYVNRNPDLWGLDLATLRSYPISARPGINASARYSPDGGRIALSLSAKGIPKIFTITPQGHIIKVLTNGRGNDISPTWSPDGSAIAYVSDHAGTPQIYVIPAEGGPPKRLTPAGSKYNTDPDWSPQGDLLAFTSRIDGRFQICTMRTDGTDFRVLTNKGANEDPAWSPDGRMITFTSNRDGKKLIYLMDARGEIQVPISPISGKTPAWSRNFR
ncbi:MAG: Tol-Pal system beta propeller repeat protein TolB [Desulfomonile tiedjei]|nr:Tol-Pal system beta propeller repeat protein TolB [Desulfomonile tiedjei]